MRMFRPIRDRVASTAAGGILDILLTLAMCISTNLEYLYVDSSQHTACCHKCLIEATYNSNMLTQVNAWGQ
jgi:hypothetical protein